MHILPSIYKESIHFFEQSFLQQLTSQQKRIAALALIVFSCLAACYAVYRCCFKERKVELDPIKEPTDIPDISQEAEEVYEDGIIVFSFEILQKMIESSSADNIAISPLGISLLLSMIKHGVSSEDQEEIERVLYLPDSETELKVSVFKLVKKLKEYGTNLASLLYLNDKYRLNPDYQRLASQYYQSKVESGSSAKEVNQWITQATNGKIQEILSQQDLNDFFLVLANAIHFKADWDKSFEAQETYLEKFLTPNGSIQTQMMHAVNEYMYVENHDYQAIILNYKNTTDVLMVLVLPKKNQDFSFVNTCLLGDIFKNSKVETIKIALPKFKIEQEIDVIGALSKMGMSQLFNKPDFRSLVDVTHGPTEQALPKLKINKIAQKTLLAFNEEGTEASSGAAAVIVKECCKQVPNYSKEICFNRPFLTALVTKEAPVLFGVVRNPST